jgi:hypothetical protein
LKTLTFFINALNLKPVYKIVPEINVLIEHMSSYIINSRIDNTAKSYYYSFNRWSTFAKKHSFDVLPAQPVHMALFITHLLDSGAGQAIVSP